MKETNIYKENSFGTKAVIPKALELAREILRCAQAQAEDIVSQATMEAQVAIDDAYAAGLEKANTEIVRKLSEIEQMRITAMEECKLQIREAVCTIAEHVVGEHLCVSPQSILSRIERVIDELRLTSGINLVVNPLDAVFVKEQMAQLYNGRPSTLTVALLEDDSIQQGDARIETESYAVTCSISRHLAAIRSVSVQ
ncbi:MAG: hypothetical protein IT291_00855 [Deltaproteobacteria bacterium]|nr:hypothetical protein [Deltaproteobacteria bacterium]